MEEQKSKVSIWSKIKKSKKLPVALGVSFLVILFGIFIFITVNTKKETANQTRGDVVFTIEGERHYRNQVLDLMKYDTEVMGVLEDDALSQAYDLKKELAAVDKLGIKPSEQEIEVEKNRLVTDSIKKLEGFNEKYEIWFNELAKLAAAKRYVGGEFAPSYKGYIFALGYSSETKKYAEDKANSLQQRISAGAKPQDILAEISRDSNIKPVVEIASNFGLDPVLLWDEEVKIDEIKNLIKQMQTTRLSDIKQSTIGEASFYYFISLTEAPSSRIVPIDEYNSALENLSANHKGFRLSSEDNGNVENKAIGTETNE